MPNESKDVKERLTELCERFKAQITTFKSNDYKEAQLRIDFLNPFFELVGWDVCNRSGKSEDYRDVITEDSIKMEDHIKAPDYCFRIGGARKFFVEAKKPSLDLSKEIEPCLQIRRYSRTEGLPLGILTDFEEFAVYDTRIKPKATDKPSTARIFYCTYNQYLEPYLQDGVEYPSYFDFICSIFSKDAIEHGAFDKWAQDNKRKGTSAVDEEFLDMMSQWRKELANNIAARNLTIGIGELNLAVQRIIDRLVFLRFAEDRGSERERMLFDIASSKEGVVIETRSLFQTSRIKYNSELFQEDEIINSIIIDDKTISNIIKSMYPPECPFEFSVMPLAILGSAYEQFLGKTITIKGGEKRHRVDIDLKPEVRKAKGVYYTPQYIVDYIVKETVGKKLETKNIEEDIVLRVIDPACGSGSFLIGAYTFLLDWHLRQYTKDGITIKKAIKGMKIFERTDDNYRLTLDEKKRILKAHIYGVDIDAQAVEVTKLSLFLKLLEGEGMVGRQKHLALSCEKLLPNLENNIKCGNSLIGPDYYDDKELSLFADDDIIRINAFDWQAAFPEVFKAGGFDCVVGNPPYVRQELLGDSKPYFEKHYKVYHGMADLYAYFFEKGIGLLKKGGRFGIIVANKWMRANYGGPLRTWLRDAGLETVIDFGDLPVFKDATTYPCIMILERDKKGTTFRAAEPEELAPADLSGYLKKRVFTMQTASLDPEGWMLLDQKKDSLLKRLKNDFRNLSEVIGGEYYSGVKIGLDEAFVIDQSQAERILKQNKKCSTILRPYLIGRDIGRYKHLEKNKYAILIQKGWTNQESQKTSNKWKWLSLEYPEITAMLAPYEEKAKKRYDQGDYWWELRSCDYYQELGRPKIVYNKFQVKPLFTFDNTGFFPNTAVFSLPTTNLLLLAILNSRLGWFLISQYCTKIQNGYQLIWKYLQKIPIPGCVMDTESSNQEIICQMLDLHKQLPSAIGTARQTLETRIAATDRQIDQLVYKLYGLTEEEIKIVEGAG